MQKKFAQILLPFGKTSQEFYTYRIPPELLPRLSVGQRVLVPFGNGCREGIVWDLIAECNLEKSVKDILAILDEQVLINDIWRQIAEWMSDQYIYPLGDALKCIFPALIWGKWKKEYEVLASWAEIENAIAQTGVSREAASHGCKSLRKALQSHKYPEHKYIKLLIEKKLIVEKYSLEKKKVKAKTVTAYYTKDGTGIPPGVSEKQKHLLEIMQNHNGPVFRQDLIQMGSSPAIAESLFRKGIIEKGLAIRRRKPAVLMQNNPPSQHTLTQDQINVLDRINEAIDKQSGEIILLHGITGSGKTEIYLRALENIIQKGLTGIYLVPEISLTPQTIERVVTRFGDDVAVLHSGLSDGERYDEWYRILNGEAKVVVGARSAVFAPLDHIGLIIIDEEHENTYKQEEHPRYHAREIAEQISKLTGAVVILGSATPSVETYYHAVRDKYVIVKLPDRIVGNLPNVHVIDLREEFKNGSRRIFSRRLLAAIEQRLSNSQQIILFLNRRGYSTFVFCRECGFALYCPNCDVSLTYHLSKNILSCHYCEHYERPPEECPCCKSHYIKYSGLGTQKIEKELKQFFPGVRVFRMDVDSMRGKDSSFHIYEKLKNKEIDVLVGTQMVAKGLDLPNITLVGIIMADGSLNFPDYRASERTFQLLTQVAGRAGRGIAGGEVILQTFNPGHYSILAASRHDYTQFYQQEIMRREKEQYPPFSNFIKISVSGFQKQDVYRQASEIAESCRIVSRELQIEPDKLKIIGPTASLIEKKQNKYWWNVLLKGSREEILKTARTAASQIKRNGSCYIGIDVNPITLL